MSRHMNPWTFIRELPQPVKGLYIAFFVVFAFAFVSLLTGFHPDGIFGVIGVVLTLLCLSMLLNINGSADAMAQQMKTMKPMGVDYSKSWFATAAYARFFGAFGTVIGGIMTVQGFMVL